MRICILALLAFQMVSAPAFALSCTPPVMNEQAVETADVIFAGKVVEANDSAGTVDPATRHDMGKYGLYVFEVAQAWKGAKAGDRITIRRNSYWGDGFPLGAEYLVFATKGADGVPEAHLCGLTGPMKYAEKSVAFLNAHFGE